VRQSYRIEVFDDDALREDCPSWHPTEVDGGLDDYRASLLDRHQVRVSTERSAHTLAWCEATGQSRFHIVCRQARAQARSLEGAIDAYVDDCERLLDVLARPGNWERLQGCLLDEGLPTVAQGLEDDCVSPAATCGRVHDHVMRMIFRASDSAHAFRNLPGCLRFLYPSAGVLEDWYTGGRPWDF
jgi:hypothetical protein